MLNKASEYVPCGVYGLEHKGKDFIELVNLPMTITQLKQYTRDAKKRGIKVYSNRGAK